MRTDAGEVLLEDFANGFYLSMRLSIDVRIRRRPTVADRRDLRGWPGGGEQVRPSPAEVAWRICTLR